MSKITITSTDAALTVNYGDYAEFIGFKSEKMNRSNVSIALGQDGSFVEFNMTKWGLWLSHDGHGATRKVDTVDGVAPTSSEDLFNKLAALIG